MQMNLSRRSFLFASAGTLFAQRQTAGTRPNIIIVVADDLGYGEVGEQPTDVPTPHIDSIGKAGVRFTNGYVSCPVCSPTRAGLITGRYQQRFGHEMNPGPADNSDPQFGLPLTEKTLPNYLKELGYATGMVGKWHLGYRPELHPLKRGFDEFFGFLGGAHSYLDARADNANLILKGTQPVDEKEYLTDAFTREAVAFIERRAASPFFLYLTYNAVHGPMHASDKRVARFAHVADEKRRTFATMMSALDDGVGQVLGMLRKKSIEENTLIFFISDNGGPTPVNTARNTPLRGFKGQVYEGGIRVPFSAQWKAKLPRGVVYDQPVIALDILPTAVAAAGGKAAANVDGVDLTPYLTGKSKEPPHAALFWRFGQQNAVRQGDWKLLHTGDGAPQLYNLRHDVAESKDLAGSEPERVRELQSAYNAWNSQLTPPKWNTRRANGRRRLR